MELLEVGKGCGRGCRFCLEGPGLPAGAGTAASTRCASRWRSIAQGGGSGSGWWGPACPTTPGSASCMQIARGGRGRGVDLLAAGRQPDRGAGRVAGARRAIARSPWRRRPGTERLRRVIRKAISDEQLFEACDLLRRYGIPNLKCYFMIGLPTETREDVEAIVDLAARLLERLRVPGPDGPPLRQADAVDLVVRAQAVDAVSVGALRRAACARGASSTSSSGAPGRLDTMRVVHENPREAALQALLARGDRRVADFIELAARARRRLAPRAARVGRRPRVLHRGGSRADRDPAVGPLRRRA